MTKNKEEIVRICSIEKTCGFDERDYSYCETIQSLYPNSVFDIDNYISDIRPQYNKSSKHKFTNKPERKPLQGAHYYVFEEGRLFACCKKKQPFEIMYYIFKSGQ